MIFSTFIHFPYMSQETGVLTTHFQKPRAVFLFFNHHYISINPIQKFPCSELIIYHSSSSTINHHLIIIYHSHEFCHPPFRVLQVCGAIPRSCCGRRGTWRRGPGAGRCDERGFFWSSPGKHGKKHGIYPEKIYIFVFFFGFQQNIKTVVSATKDEEVSEFQQQKWGLKLFSGEMLTQATNIAGFSGENAGYNC